MIILSPMAAQEVKRLYEQVNLSQDTYVRIQMKAGGCSGFDLSMFPDEPTKFDLTFQSNEVNIVIDKKSHLYLDGTEVDYELTGLTGGFKFYPPNASAACGCGTSFAFNPSEAKKEGTTPTFEFSL